MPTPRITNIVTTMDLGCPVNLLKIAYDIPNTKFNYKTYPAVFVKMREPSSTFTIFKNGKVISHGNKTVTNAELSAEKLALMLNRLKIPAQVKEFRVRNVCGTIDFGFRINLVDLNEASPEFSSYNLKGFRAGLTFRLQNPKVTAKIFSNGKVNFMGAKNEEQLHEAADQISLFLGFFQMT